MKFFTRRQMRSIHISMQKRKMRLRANAQEDDATPVKQPFLKLLAPNLDRLFIVCSLVSPPFKPGLAARLLVLAESEGVQPVIVLNKIDLDPQAAERYRKLYAGLGYIVKLTSTLTGVGIDELKAMLGGRAALCGHSGVGKSSLLRALAQAVEAKVNEVSQSNNKGQHTTTTVKLYRLKEGDLFDLPGLKMAPLSLTKGELGRYFPEFAACRCKFRDCLHQTEPGCGVLESLQSGLVDDERYQAYLRILSSLREC